MQLTFGNVAAMVEMTRKAGEGEGFGGDLRRLPRLLFGFVAVLPRKIARKLQSRSSQTKSRIMCGDVLNGGSRAK